MGCVAISPDRFSWNNNRMKKNQDQALRDHLVALMRGGSAHATFQQAVANFPATLHGQRAKGSPFTPWQLLEHMRIAQWDILEFSRDPKHVSPDFPAGYWPKTDAPPTGTSWEESVRLFERDLRVMEELVKNPATDLFAPIPHGEGQTILREALLVADHNAYHLGQLILIRRLLGAWE